MGDLNDFEFPNPIMELKGEDNALVNLVDSVPEAEQYSFIFDGNSQVLDHMLVTQALQGEVNSGAPEDLNMVHAAADYAGRESDHDPALRGEVGNDRIFGGNGKDDRGIIR